MKNIRIIKVLDNDVEACGGIHMESKGGIGLIKIVDTQKIQDGLVRLKYVVEDYALDYVHGEESLLNEIKKMYNVDDKSVVKTSRKFFDEYKKQKKVK